mmetsp:Transcript_125656/g.391274  ORF Transcript_125656/g.391274 Transcript_125656/m.391274 type:complete len:253 (-) Transcript_125656:1537-2295(-)
MPSSPGPECLACSTCRATTLASGSSERANSRSTSSGRVRATAGGSAGGARPSASQSLSSDLTSSGSASPLVRSSGQRRTAASGRIRPSQARASRSTGLPGPFLSSASRISAPSPSGGGEPRSSRLAAKPAPSASRAATEAQRPMSVVRCWSRTSSREASQASACRATASTGRPSPRLLSATAALTTAAARSLCLPLGHLPKSLADSSGAQPKESRRAQCFMTMACATAVLACVLFLYCSSSSLPGRCGTRSL